MTDSERRFMLYGGFVAASTLMVYANVEYSSAKRNLRKAMSAYDPVIHKTTHEIHLRSQALTEEQIA